MLMSQSCDQPSPDPLLQYIDDGTLPALLDRVQILSIDQSDFERIAIALASPPITWMPP
jgi:hypothetical protein